MGQATAHPRRAYTSGASFRSAGQAGPDSLQVATRSPAGATGFSALKPGGYTWTNSIPVTPQKAFQAAAW
jgi:hypothetical protein